MLLLVSGLRRSNCRTGIKQIQYFQYIPGDLSDCGWWEYRKRNRWGVGVGGWSKGWWGKGSLVWCGLKKIKNRVCVLIILYRRCDYCLILSICLCLGKRGGWWLGNIRVGSIGWVNTLFRKLVVENIRLGNTGVCNIGVVNIRLGNIRLGNIGMGYIG